MLLEVLWKGHHLGNCVSEVRYQIPDSRRVGPKPGHQTRARRVADGLLAIRSRERNTCRRLIGDESDFDPLRSDPQFQALETYMMAQRKGIEMNYGKH